MPLRHLICCSVILLRLYGAALADGAPGNPVQTAVVESGPLREQPIRRFRKQAIQKVTVSGGWLASTDGNDLNTSHVSVSTGLGVPLGSFENILGVTPSFRVDRLDAAAGIDVPTELYEAGIQFFARKPLKDRLTAMMIVRPSVRSDFTTGDNAFRVFGMALLNWEKVPDQLVLSGGVVSLGRADIPVLPAVGLTWTPNVRTKLGLRFPESRWSWRVQRTGNENETWAHISAGIGGNTWAVTRRSGRTDELSIRDVRLQCGLEHIVDGGSGWFFNGGWAFARKLEYEQTATQVSLNDGVFLQGGFNY